MTADVPVHVEIESATQGPITAEAEVFVSGPEPLELTGGTFTIDQLKSILLGADRLSHSAAPELAP
jgi:hypothetical protein